jgi:type II secretory pathway pseudopilin PulG
MGQQQLLLVILVTIIVGIATVVAINTFGTAADQANIDAVNNDIATLASAAQGYFMRPEMLGGGGRSFVGLDFEGLAFPSTFQDNESGDPVAVNENGRYVLKDIAAGAFTIEAFPASSEGYVAGTDPSTTVSTGGEATTAGVGPNIFELDATAEDISPTTPE